MPIANSRLVTRALVACGLVASPLYVIIDVLGALHYPGYDYSAQAISEMSAIGAPTADFLAPFYAVWSLLFVGFAAGTWLIATPRSPLRWSASLLIAVAGVGSGLSYFPMHQRNADPTISDTMHLVFAGAIILLLSAAIVTGARAFGRGFRRYSAATVTVMLVFFLLAMSDVPNVGADRATPLMGLNERIGMAAWLLWIAVLSARLLARRDEPLPTSRTAG